MAYLIRMLMCDILQMMAFELNYLNYFQSLIIIKINEIT
jgi:hypothetical protein